MGEGAGQDRPSKWPKLTAQISDREEFYYPSVQTDIKILRAVNLGHFEVQNRGWAPYRSLQKPMFFQRILKVLRVLTGPRNSLSAGEMEHDNIFRVRLYSLTLNMLTRSGT